MWKKGAKQLLQKIKSVGCLIIKHPGSPGGCRGRNRDVMHAASVSPAALIQLGFWLIEIIPGIHRGFILVCVQPFLILLSLR